MTRDARGTARDRTRASVVRTGHTLVEMVVTLAIVGIMAATVAPALRVARDDDARRGTRAVVALLEAARATAATRGVAVTLVVDVSTLRAWVTPGDGAPTIDAGTIDLGDAGTLQARARRARWTFMPTGAAFGDAIVVSDAGRAVRIAVDPWTGEVHAEPW